MKLISSIQNAHLPTVTVEPGPAAVCQPSSASVVAERRLSDAELDAHIDDCATHLMRAYARYQDSRLPADREEAVLWLELERIALLERQARHGVERHAEFERRLDEGVDYFQVQGARDRAAMEGVRR